MLPALSLSILVGFNPTFHLFWSQEVVSMKWNEVGILFHVWVASEVSFIFSFASSLSAASISC